MVTVPLTTISKSNRAWVRVIEAVIGIMIFLGILLMVYSNRSSDVDISDGIYEMQVNILKNIALNDSLRHETLVYDGSLNAGNYAPLAIVEFVNQSLPNNINFEVRVCDIEDFACKMEILVEVDVFVEEAIISSNLFDYSPKKIKLFVWFG